MNENGEGNSQSAIEKLPLWKPGQTLSSSERELLSPDTKRLINASQRPEGTGIQLPEGIKPTLGLDLPTELTQGIVPATDKEILELVPKTNTQPKPPKWNESEKLLARSNPRLFFRQQFAKEHPNDTGSNEALELFLKQLGATATQDEQDIAPEGDFHESAFQRKRHTKTFHVKDAEMPEEYFVTTPSAVESVGILVAELMQDSELDQGAKEKFLTALHETLRTYRLHYSLEALPEMPDMVKKLMEATKESTFNKRSRYRIYDVVYQIQLGRSEEEDAMQVIDSNEDLTHPLAYGITLDLAQYEKSAWVQTQQERRQHLLTRLTGTPQEVFDLYDKELVKLRKGLVTSIDLVTPPQGKVGNDMEFAQSSPTPYGHSEYQTVRLVPEGWGNLNRDGANLEIKKNEDTLLLNREYFGSLTGLTRWLADNSETVSAWHFHLDRVQHPFEPRLGELLGNTNETVRESHKGTWEERGMVAPLYVNTINPAIIADAIDLLVYDATHPEEMGERIEVTKDTSLTWQKIAFGNIAVHSASPEARLATLMALSDPLTLQGVNPYFILRSYTEESFPYLLSSLKENLKGKDQQRRILVLDSLGTGVDIANTYPSTIKGIPSELVDFLRNHDAYQKKVDDMRQFAEIERKLQVGTSLDALDLAFLYDTDRPKGFGESGDSNIEERIKEIRSQRNQNEDMPIVFACEPSQIARHPSEIRAGTRAYIGPLVPGIFDRLTEANVEHIYTSFPEGKIRRQSLEIGGKTREQLQTELQQAGVNMTSYAQDMMRSRDFTTLPYAETVDTVRIKVQDLGLSGYPTTDQIYQRAQELGLELCPAEVGPNYRLQYADQPQGEWFYIGMKQIADSNGDPNVFALGRDGDGLWLGDGWAKPDKYWSPNHEFVFSLRKSESQKPQTLSSLLILCFFFVGHIFLLYCNKIGCYQKVMAF